MEKTFSEWKKQSVNKQDQSKKSSVDEDITQVVSLLNGREEYFTTSSCSGRIILIDAVHVAGHSEAICVLTTRSEGDRCAEVAFTWQLGLRQVAALTSAPPEESAVTKRKQVAESCVVQKQNCVWLFVSHQKCTSEDLMSGLSRSTADAVLKFEPFILHVQCRQLEDAQLVHSVAINSGFRNSGLSVSKKGKILTAVRSTHGLEVPLSHKGQLLVDNHYIKFLTKMANQKMEENFSRIQRFYQNLQSALSEKMFQNLQIPDTGISVQQQDPPHRLETEKGQENREEEKNKTTVYKRRRKREQHHQADCCHGDKSITVPELDDCLDLFT